MANDIMNAANNVDNPDEGRGNVKRPPEQVNSGLDPERAMPDPEQVERDRQQFHEQYGEENEKDNAA